MKRIILFLAVLIFSLNANAQTWEKVSITDSEGFEIEEVIRTSVNGTLTTEQRNEKINVLVQILNEHLEITFTDENGWEFVPYIDPRTNINQIPHIFQCDCYSNGKAFRPGFCVMYSENSHICLNKTKIIKQLKNCQNITIYISSQQEKYTFTLCASNFSEIYR